MMLAPLGIYATQEHLTELAGAVDTIEEHGTRLDQLAAAVRGAAPHLRLWFKDHSSAEELHQVVMEHGFAAAVEWQGLFEDSVEDEDEDGDYGHYSIVTNVDLDAGRVTILDPYKDFVADDRIFALDFFLTRWWDTNEVADPETGKPVLIEDYHLMFIIAPEEESFPAALGMRTL